MSPWPPVDTASNIVQRTGSPVRHSSVSKGVSDRSIRILDLSAEAEEHAAATCTVSGAASRGESASKRTRTTALVYSASILEKADEAIFPAVFLFVSHSLGVSVSTLGWVSMGRAATQALMSPVSGYLGEKYNRAYVIGAGCCIWGVMAAGLGLGGSIPVMMLFSAGNGIGLSLVIPSCQSLIADFYASSSRGKAFGLLQMLMNFGGFSGSAMATNLGGKRIMGMEGWRFFYQIVALVSFLCGVVVACFAQDPRFAPGGSKAAEHNKLNGQSELSKLSVCSSSSSSSHGGSSSSSSRGGSGSSSATSAINSSLWPETFMIFRLRSFQIIIAQGIVGTMPWFCAAYFTMLFQLRGFNDRDSSMLTGCFTLASALGSYLGGHLGDMASRWSPNHGRIYVAQTSVLFSIPFAYLVLQIIPNMAPTSFSCYAVTLLIFGVTASWSGSACNNPIFAEVVPEHLRSMIYAYDRCLEGGIAAMIMPVVGIMAENLFGYHKVPAGQIVTPEEARTNGAALGQALTVTMILPWVMCLGFYCFLHHTYSNDRDLAASGMYKRIREKSKVNTSPETPSHATEP